MNNDLHENISRDEAKLAGLRAALNTRSGLPEAAFAPPHDFAYFTLNEAPGPYRFPARVPERDELEAMRVATYERFYAAERRKGISFGQRVVDSASYRLRRMMGGR